MVVVKLLFKNPPHAHHIEVQHHRAGEMAQLESAGHASIGT